MRTGLVLLILLIMAGCGIFDLKNAESPQNENGTDPLNLGHVLSIDGAIAANVDYADLFTEDVVFEYSLAMAQIKGREKVLKMLEYLKLQTSGVDWLMDKAIEKNEGHLQFYENVPYFVYYDGETICSGYADFRIVKDHEWKIVYWKDVPDDPREAFFIP
ncbi:MAG: hypothetical protein ACLFVQ_13935 [Chitinispirillaceae bacterium]